MSQPQYGRFTRQVDGLHNVVRATSILGSGKGMGPKISAQNITGNEPNYRSKMHDFLGNIMNNASSSPSASYAACLANPAVHQCRIPDSFARPTALYLSRKIMTLTVGPQVNNGVQGRFAFCSSPILGNIDDPLHYQDAFCDPAFISDLNQSAIDWTSTTPYLNTTQGLNNVDPRIDNNIQTLTQGDFGLYRATTGTTGVSNALPFGTAQPTIDSSSNNLQVLYSTNLGNSTFKIPQGQYIVTVVLTGAAITVLSQVSPTTATDVTASVIGFNNTATNYWVQYAVTATRQATNLRLAVTGGGAGVTSGLITIVPTMFDNTAIDEDNGFVEKLRPVAMSVLVTYTGTSLQNGGDIAIALVPGDTKSSKFVTNQAEEPGNLRTWDNIANLNAETYRGRLENGAYCYWVPESNKDYEFVLPSEMNSQEYPTIVCAGEFMPGSAIASNTVIGQVIIYRLFEYETVSTLVDKQFYAGGQDYMDGTFRFLSTQPRAMENPQHVPWYKRLLSAVGKVGAFAAKVAPIALSFL